VFFAGLENIKLIVTCLMLWVVSVTDHNHQGCCIGCSGFLCKKKGIKKGLGFGKCGSLAV
jgi:hypothetical protein